MSQFLPNRLTAWSYSRFNDYCTCPAKAKYKHVMKMKEPGNAAMDRGQRIHKLAEDHTKGTLRALPPELSKFKVGFAALRKNKALAEQEWAFDFRWQPVSWFAKDAWCRIKVDAVSLIRKEQTLLIVDHKTGRKYPGNQLQLDLYAVGGFTIYPEVKIIRTELWYLDEGGAPVSALYEAERYPEIRKDWEGRVKMMMADKVFKPKPGDHCRRCHFRKDNDGPCRF